MGSGDQQIIIHCRAVFFKGIQLTESDLHIPAVQHDNHDIAQAIGTINLSILLREITGELTCQVAPRLMVSTYHFKRNGRSKTFHADIDKGSERQFGTVHVIHHVACIKESMTGLVVSPMQQGVQLGGIAVHIAGYEYRGSLTFRVNRRKGMPRRGYAVAEHHLIRLKTAHLFRKDAVIVGFSRLQFLQANGVECVISHLQPVIRCIISHTLLLRRPVRFYFHPRKSFPGSLEYHGRLIRGHFLQIRAMG